MVCSWKFVREVKADPSGAKTTQKKVFPDEAKFSLGIAILYYGKKHYALNLPKVDFKMNYLHTYIRFFVQFLEITSEVSKEIFCWVILLVD